MPFSREQAALHQLEDQLRNAVHQLRVLAKSKRDEADGLKPDVYHYSSQDFLYGWHAGTAHAYAAAAVELKALLAQVERFHERQAS